jgi:hypothetical protein
MIGRQRSKRSPGYSTAGEAEGLGRARAAIRGWVGWDTSTPQRAPLGLLLLVTGFSTWHWTAPIRVRSERKREQEQCVANLKEVYHAFEGYWRDHHGADPPSPLALYPHYLKSLNTFVCPAYDSSRFTVPVSLQMRFGGRTAVDTYFFPYVELGDADMRLKRDRVPLVVCSVHAQLVYEDSYRQLSPLQMKRNKRAFVRRYGVPTLLALGRDGEVHRFSDLDTPEEGPAMVDFDLTTRTRGAGLKRTQSSPAGQVHSSARPARASG